jgi:hypothetical protein
MLYNMAIQQLRDADLLMIFPAYSPMTLHRRAAAIRRQMPVNTPHATSSSDVDHQVISPLHLRSIVESFHFADASF